MAHLTIPPMLDADSAKTQVENSGLSASAAFRFVVILGIANLFADMTYEGARSVSGPFLGSLGASAAVVGFTAGFGELIGYGLRLLTGLVSDKTGRYWAMTIVGYAINMLAVPALALTGNWPLAAGLVVAERAGRAIRKPSTSAMLSFAGKHMGQGWVFGLNEALDQTGATIGPLIISFILFRHGEYRTGFAVLLIPAVITIVIVVTAHHFFPNPHHLDAAVSMQTKGFPKSYWLYLLGGGCVAAGFADFALIAFHFQKTRSVSAGLTPVYYAVAMAVGAVGALVFGKLYDRVGLAAAIAAFLASAFFAPLVFLGGAWLALAGMVLWGIGMGAQESLLKSMIAGLIGSNRRATAFGVFDGGFGVAWFGGSWLMGFLYARSILSVVAFSVALQLLSVPILIFARRFANPPSGR